MPSRKKQKDGVAGGHVSLRGDNRFVQMAVCEVDSELKPNFMKNTPIQKIPTIAKSQVDN